VCTSFPGSIEGSRRTTHGALGSTGLMLTQSPMRDIMQKPYSEQSGVVVNRCDPASCSKDNGTLDEA
jgi:hypothetical protein